MGGSGRERTGHWDDGVQMGKGEDTRGGMGLMADIGEDELAGISLSLLERAPVRVHTIRENHVWRWRACMPESTTS
jgi:hypothetical protein